MTKIAFVADVHLGNHKRHGGAVERSMNVRCRRTLDVLRASLRTAVDCGCAVYAVVGDLFDTAHPEAPLIGATAQAFSEECHGYDDGVRVMLVKGNHEMISETDGDHALSALGYVEHIYVIDSPQACSYGNVPDNARCNVIYLPYKSGAKATDWLPEAYESLSGRLLAMPKGKHLLAAHVGVYDEHSPGYLRSARDAVSSEWLRKFMKERDISGAFVGNYHNEAHWHAGTDGVGIHQCGALVPTGWDNPGVDYGQMLVYDTVTHQTTSYRISGPRFETVRSVDAAEKFAAKCAATGCAPYVRVVVPVGEMETATKWVRDAKYLAGGEVVVDDSTVREHAQQAAAVARSQETLDNALSLYIGALEMPTDVERTMVYQRCETYLNGGKR